MSKNTRRYSGKVKWYNKRKGFGFITIIGKEHGQARDVFLHHSAVQQGIEVKEGDDISFLIEQDEKGPSAKDVKKSSGMGNPAPAVKIAPPAPRQPVKASHDAIKKNTDKNRANESKGSKRNAIKGSYKKDPAVLHDLKEETRDRKNTSKKIGDDQQVSTSPFKDLGLIPELVKATVDSGYVEPTPIQIQTIPIVLAGSDVIGCAQTGTGKTAAFALPILQYLSENPPRNGKTRKIRTLVLAPTRELAIQIADSFTEYGMHTRIRNTVIYGGVGQNPQVVALKRGVDVLVATPGRLLDLIGQGFVKLGSVEVLVFDEADRMLDMGFIHDIRRILKFVPIDRQSLLFSATIPPEIVRLSRNMLQNPKRVTISPDRPAVEIITQSVFHVSKRNKQPLLEYILGSRDVTRALVFSRTKHGANRIVKKLVRIGISAEPIHGNKSQTARQRALSNFRDGTTRVLVATDVAARGIDVDDISHVIQFDLPNVPETYIHRIGRTGRAGATGIAISFCMETEEKQLKDIEKLIRFRIPVVKKHPFLS
ncbi:MAG: DEAD/DEAH box helicase [Promethearchaeota archaeon]